MFRFKFTCFKEILLKTLRILIFITKRFFEFVFI